MASFLHGRFFFRETSLRSLIITSTAATSSSSPPSLSSTSSSSPHHQLWRWEGFTIEQGLGLLGRLGLGKEEEHGLIIVDCGAVVAICSGGGVLHPCRKRSKKKKKRVVLLFEENKFLDEENKRLPALLKRKRHHISSDSKHSSSAFVKIWSTRNKRNSAMLEMTRTTGTKSFARIAEEMIDLQKKILENSEVSSGFVIT